MPAQMAVLFIAIFTLIEWPQLETASKILALIAASLVALLLPLGFISSEQLLFMCSSVAFFAFFLMALHLLKEAALTSKSVYLTGQALLQQQPTRRYTLLTVASHLLGILMSMGAISLFATMIQRSLQEQSTELDANIRQIRQKRMMQAVLRGFCSIPLWAPTTVTITLLVTTMPNLQWLDILPYGLILTFAALIFGIALDHIQAPTHLNHLVPQLSNKLSDLRVCKSIFVVVINLVVLSAILLYSTQLSVISAVLVSASLTSCGWIFFQYKHQASISQALVLTKTRFSQKLFTQLPSQRSELVFFTSSVLIGQLLISQLNIAWFSQHLVAMELSAPLILIMASWLIVISSMLYINPIISVTFVAGTLWQTPMLTTMPITLALVLMVTWAAVIGSSPTSSSVRIGAKIANVSPIQLGLKWNGLYSLVLLILLDAYLLMFL
ncbi:hypothetical protein [Paraglaciecola aestuariivivens]